jgi:hypothetical protein
MSEDFVRRVLKQHAQTNMTKQPDLWPALSRLVQPLPRSPRNRLGAPTVLVAGLTALLVLLAIAAATLLNQPRPVSAAEIIARAKEVAKDDKTSLQTFHGVMTHWFIAYEPAGETVEGRSEEWYQADPYRFLQKGTFQISDGTGYESMYGSDEKYTYLAHEEDDTLVIGKDGVLENGVLKRPIDPKHPRMFGPYSWLDQVGSSGKGKGTNEQEFNYLDLFDMALLGTDKIGGRDVYILELTANPAGRGYPAVTVPIAKSKMWVDQQLFLILRTEAYDANGELTARAAFETFEVNQPVDPALFDFSSPKHPKK